MACRHGHVEVIKLLLGESQGLVEGGCKWKQTPASYSLALLSEVTDDGWYPLHEAVWNNKQTTIKFLLPFHTHSDVINISKNYNLLSFIKTFAEKLDKFKRLLTVTL